MKLKEINIGLDVGSTSVKAVVVDEENRILWKKYIRHETRQAETVLTIFRQIEKEFDPEENRARLFLTGSGSQIFMELTNGKYVQEVNAITYYVEKMLPEVSSIIELGGQDAKIIIFLKDENTSHIRKVATMNDKCAGGTGSVIDKISSKLSIAPDKIAEQKYNGYKIHQIAGKCGVFAETDINSLQKQGVDKNELMASLFDSIVQQNLSVLTRGYTLRSKVALLGGPNTFIKGLVECWQSNIFKLWNERKYDLPEFDDINDLIFVPENSEFFAALGCILFSKNNHQENLIFCGSSKLKEYIDNGKKQYRILSEKRNDNTRIKLLYEDIEVFKKKYSIPKFNSRNFAAGETAQLFVGIDGGSTSSKAVLIDKNGEVVKKYYQISLGNPFDDVKEIFTNLQEQVENDGARLEIMGVGVTGYAKDIIKDSINADVALVETVAHTNASKFYYKDIDVVCDVGGQDIKIIILRNGRVVDFKLNTQCSAGNGYFLQNTAESFGIKMEDFAERAFNVDSYPEFGYGCAVFLQSDIVNFQRQGWSREEILAGLACVLPKNIWQYVCQIPNLPQLGKTFVLTGGTQYNLAAAKAQVDFIEAKFREKDSEPNIFIHEHAGECGAIGAALEAKRLFESGKKTCFIGIERVKSIKYTTYRDERTKCEFCKNNCNRTFIDINTSNVVQHHAGDNFPYKQGPELTKAGRIESTETEMKKKKKEKLDIEPGTTRIIIASCEKGTVEDVNDMREIQEEITLIKTENPNMLEFASDNLWKSYNPQVFKRDILNLNLLFNIPKLNNFRGNIKIGIPRVLNLYQFAPFFTAYFECLGIRHTNIIFSDYTSEKMYKEGSRRGSIDPCFPSKVTLAHIHNLLFKKHKATKLDMIFFPMVDTFLSDIKNTVDHRACPAGLATPQTVKAAFTKEKDLFAEFHIDFINPFISLNNPDMCEFQLYKSLKSIMKFSQKENHFAIQEGYKALASYNNTIRDRGKNLLHKLEYQDRVGIVILARPYHNDIGINHGIPEEFQKLGYPILSQESLPHDEYILNKLFKDDLRTGLINDPMEISDVWKNSFSENTSRKIWAAKFTARHPNLVALELSNFKCGHDAPIYSVVRDIIEYSGTPFFTFRDIDENKASGSLKIRVETIDYFLKRYQDFRNKKNENSEEINHKIGEDLLKQHSQISPEITLKKLK